MKKIAITMGDPAGIGPEIVLKSLNKLTNIRDFVLIGNRKILEMNEKICNVTLSDNIEFIDIECDIKNIHPKIENKYSGELAYKSLKKACDMVNSNDVSMIATAPLSKNALHLAGHNYSGQTEILQSELSINNNDAQMLFVAENLKIILLTRHIPIKDITSFITEENIINTANILNNELQKYFNISKPKIAMSALNPHCGENGILGNEEIKIITPTLDKLKKSGIDILGPYSADTLFGKAIQSYIRPDFDAYIACYHDQVLPAIKSIGLDKVLNITIGLKALRSSPSHGTAFDIAYQDKADFRSMLNSIIFLQNKSCLLSS